MKPLSCSMALGLLLSLSLQIQAQTQAQTDPREILARQKAASGGAAWDSVKTLHGRARVEVGGMTGTAESWEDVLAGRFVDTFEIGPVTGAEGYDGTRKWSQDESGEVTLSEGGDAREGSVNESYRRSFSSWYADRRPGQIATEGERREGDRVFHVLRITPQGGRPFEMWIDVATFLTDRIVEKGAVETRTTLLADYREVQGLRLPFRLLVTNGEKQYDQVVNYETYEINPAIDAAKFDVPSSRADDFSIAGGAASVDLPFELINNHIYADAQIDGRPVRILLDTGGANIVTPAAAQALGLKSEGSFQARGTGEQSESFGVARVKEVQIGGATVRDQVFLVMPLRDLDKVEGVEFAGILGFEVFKRFVVRIDYAKRVVSLIFPESFQEPAGATSVPFTFDETTPQIEGKIDGVPGKFTIDTGSRSSLSLLRPFAEKNGFFEKTGPKIEALAGWGVGGGGRGLVTRAGLLELGTVKIPAPVTTVALQERGAFSDPYVAGNVGGGALRRFTVTFDYRNHRIFFEPNASAGTPDVWDRSGLWMNLTEGGYRIEDVVAGSPAAAAGLKVGDTVLSVNGRAASTLPLAEAREILKSAPGTAVRLRVRSGDVEREVEMVLKDLV
jgi:hypothetical protein